MNAFPSTSPFDSEEDIIAELIGKEKGIAGEDNSASDSALDTIKISRQDLENWYYELGALSTRVPSTTEDDVLDLRDEIYRYLP